MESVDAIVIGAGVVGLACARALAMHGLDTLIVERHERFGSETSARNSEVIHAGLYYPCESLKARLCVRGNALLYDFCDSHGIAYRRCGKLIVATSEAQDAHLRKLQGQGIANGVPGLDLLSARQAQALEPALRCIGALQSHTTGIIDSHALMLALLGDAERHGATLVCRSTVGAGTVGQDGIVLEIDSAGERLPVAAEIVINAAGLGAQSVAEGLVGFPQDRVPHRYLAKGNYYALAARNPFSRLIYPVPEAAGLGVHLTFDLAGQARFGPDVEWVTELDYDVDPERAGGFYAAVRRYWPGLPDDALSPAFCGIRPKLAGPDEAAADFMIQGPAEHGIPGLVQLFGIESPGLTACLAIAETVLETVGASVHRQ